jgi:hypothetical protein
MGVCTDRISAWRVVAREGDSQLVIGAARLLHRSVLATQPDGSLSL